MDDDQGSEGIADESPTPPGVSRGQNQLHVLPEDWQAGAGLIAPLLDRVDGSVPAPQLLIVTADAESAAGLGGRLVPLAAAAGAAESGAAGSGGGARTLSATEARRAGRVQRASPAQVIVGPPSVLVELLQSATLKVDAVRAVVLAWVDDVGETARSALETVMSELPKDAPRIVFASAVTPDVEQLVERYARRARRPPPGGEDLSPVALSYLAVGEVARPMALRRILDALDPESAFIVARAPESLRDVQALLGALGYAGDDGAVRVGDAPGAGGGSAQLIVLYDLPASEEQLRRMAAAPAEGRGTRVVALVAPRQVNTLRRMAGGAVTPLVLPDAAIRARSREESLRDELRDALAAGGLSRELLALEPLLSDYDGAEVAAAALRLLETGRARPRTAAAPPETATTKLFINVGEMDGVRPGDLIGAIVNEAGVSKSELGKVEVRERHSTVEVATGIANMVVSKLMGVTIRGRRAMVKVDEGGAPRRDRPSSRSDSGPRRDRPDRGGRAGGAGGRGGRGDRPRPTRPRRELPRRDD